MADETKARVCAVVGVGPGNGEAFARRFGFSVAAVRDWEQQRRRPEKAARILLRMIERRPELVLEALAAE